MSKSSQSLPIAVFVIAGICIGGLGLWGLQRVWTYAGELDAQPERGGLKKPLMQRKSDAMHDLLDAAIAGNMDRVESAAARIEASAKGIDGYLSTDIYERQGQEFFEAIREVERAAVRRDYEATNEAALRLEASCLGCHREMNDSSVN